MRNGSQVKSYGCFLLDIMEPKIPGQMLVGYFDEDVRLLEFSSIFILPLYKACCSHHAAVLSMESGIPIVAVSMDERLDGILRELGFETSYLHHVTDADLADAIFASMKSCLWIRCFAWQDPYPAFARTSRY